MIFSQRKWLFTLHWVQISFPLGIPQSSATNPLLTTQDDLLWGLTSFEGAERERVARRPVVVPRWSISGGFRADRNVILAQGRRNDLVSSWEENFHSQHVIPFATELCCCEFLPTLSWTLNNRKWLNNGMGLDFNWFPEPWQSHMNNDRCMYTEINPV